MAGPRYDRIPVAYMREGVVAYCEERRQPGDFLTAIICNDLRGAVLRADDTNTNHLASWVRWFMWEAPIGSWGCREAMEEWIAGGEDKMEHVISTDPQTYGEVTEGQAQWLAQRIVKLLGLRGISAHVQREGELVPVDAPDYPEEVFTGIVPLTQGGVCCPACRLAATSSSK
ncbi:hypothetical protein LCGC14_1551130 [marine sediment metagenome]|uniref:Uncharacterized protein n=1 Tax=marine sediment metagenome TaxID=412755 RepID=A0A0F9IQD4_9ZZZZ